MGKDVNKEDDVAVLCASWSDFGVASKVITTPPPIVAARPALSTPRKSRVMNNNIDRAVKSLGYLVILRILSASCSRV